ncbi:hypothetical protein BgiBS90_016486 [Biomphalaria glabrata]|nr:hypothetical protein BgiBS90_016486 [Biomphalaria glabrata]
MSCSSLSKVYMAENANELIRLMLLNQDECRVSQKLENYFELFQCYSLEQFRNNIIDACDPTDPRKLKDPDIVKACRETTGVRNEIYSIYDFNLYKNIFCYICGTVSLVSYTLPL